MAYLSLTVLVETGPIFVEVPDTWCLVVTARKKPVSTRHSITHKQISRFIISAPERLELFGREEWLRNSETLQTHWIEQPNQVFGYMASQAEQNVVAKIENQSEILKDSSLKFLVSRGEEGSKSALVSKENTKYRVMIPEFVNRYATGEGFSAKKTNFSENKFTQYYSHPKLWVIRIQKLRWKQRIVIPIM